MCMSALSFPLSYDFSKMMFEKSFERLIYRGGNPRLESSVPEVKPSAAVTVKSACAFAHARLTRAWDS